MCTTRLKIQKFCVLTSLFGFQNGVLFPYTALTDYFFIAERECLLRGTDWVFPHNSGSCFVFSGFTIVVSLSFSDTNPTFHV
jgi:hypothetical protein